MKQKLCFLFGLCMIMSSNFELVNAQYTTNYNSSLTVEEALEIQKRKIQDSTLNPYLGYTQFKNFELSPTFLFDSFYVFFDDRVMYFWLIMLIFGSITMMVLFMRLKSNKQQ